MSHPPSRFPRLLLALLIFVMIPIAATAQVDKGVIEAASARSPDTARVPHDARPNPPPRPRAGAGGAAVVRLLCRVPPGAAAPPRHATGVNSSVSTSAWLAGW